MWVPCGVVDSRVGLPCPLPPDAFSASAFLWACNACSLFSLLAWVLYVRFTHAHSFPPLLSTHTLCPCTGSSSYSTPHASYFHYTTTMNYHTHTTTTTTAPAAAAASTASSSSSFPPSSSSSSPCPSSSNPQPPAAKRKRLYVPASIPPLPTLPAAGAVNQEDPAALCAPLPPYIYSLSSFTLGRRSSSSPPPSLKRSSSAAAIESRRASVRLRESYSFGELAALAAAGGHLEGGAGGGGGGGEGGGGQRKGWGSVADQVAQ